MDVPADIQRVFDAGSDPSSETSLQTIAGSEWFHREMLDPAMSKLKVRSDLREPLRNTAVIVLARMLAKRPQLGYDPDQGTLPAYLRKTAEFATLEARRQVLREEGHRLGASLVDDPLDSSWDRDALERTCKNELRVLVGTVINAMPDPDRTIMVLKHFELWTLEAIAEEFQETIEWVRYRLKKGMKTLRFRVDAVRPEE